MNLAQLQRLCWPTIRFSQHQQAIIHSVSTNIITMAPAANMVGKDYVAGFLALGLFIINPNCRIVTTSVKSDHLRILWGEINNFIINSEYVLDADKGGPLVINHREIKKIRHNSLDPKSYLIGCVSKTGEGMSGHHAPYTLAIVDEASGVDDKVFEAITTWANRILIIGNPNPTLNYFYQGVKAGDKKDATNGHYYRKIIKIRAEDSPNVRFGLAQVANGKPATNRILIPGILTYKEYLQRREMWDPVRKCIGLDAEFYEGASFLMFPPEWLNAANTFAGLGRKLVPMAIGIDTAEGGNNTSYCVVAAEGIVELISEQTADTSLIPNRTIALLKKYKIDPQSVLFDAGGGGVPHANEVRSRGYNVRTVAFGESARPELTRWRHTFQQKVLDREQQYAYKNRRAQMYGVLREMVRGGGFGIPPETRGEPYRLLRDTLSVVPLLFDREGQLYLPPKRKPPNSNIKSMIDLCGGRSPDEADSLVLATYGLATEPPPQIGLISVRGR